MEADGNRYTKQATNRRIAAHEHFSESQRLEKELEAFIAHLPANERYSQKNLELRAYSRRLPRFIMTHIWWHQCHCVLLRDLILDPMGPTAIRVSQLAGENGLSQSRARCLLHAIGTAEAFASLLDLQGEMCMLDMEMAHCAFTAAEILLYSDDNTRTSVALTREGVLQHASACLQQTRQLLLMYPTISAMVRPDSWLAAHLC